MTVKGHLQRVKADLAKYCSYRERSENEVREKLQKFQIGSDEQREVLDFLKTNNFLDEERFVSAYVNDKFRFNKWGKRKISFQLKQLNVNTILIENTLDRIPQKYYENTIKELALKKISQLTGKNQIEIKAKTTNFLVSRGFDYQEINNAIEKVMLGSNL